MKEGLLRIVGTSHIAKESVDEVRRVIAEWRPDIVAVELDHRRLHALFDQEQRGLPLRLVRLIGVRGYFFLLVARWLQQRLGRLANMLPGADMKAAVLGAREAGAKVALIDQDLEVTLRRFSAALTWREKFRFGRDIVLGLFGRGAASNVPIQMDLSRVPSPDLINEAMGYVKERYPNMYRVLVEERNQIMARNLTTLLGREPGKRIMAVVGAGHEQEIFRLVHMRQDS